MISGIFSLLPSLDLYRTQQKHNENATSLQYVGIASCFHNSHHRIHQA